MKTKIITIAQIISLFGGFIIGIYLGIYLMLWCGIQNMINGNGIFILELLKAILFEFGFTIPCITGYIILCILRDYK